MIARHDTQYDRKDLWAALAAPLPAGSTMWRQDGRSIQRDGRWFARFVAYVDANTVRERLDGVVPGEWDLTLDLLPPVPGQDDDAPACSFKARLQILGVIREDVGTGRDYKAAATDAFKRAAVRFGVGHELYALEPNWVPVDGEGRHARPLEDPQAAYDRRHAARANGGGRAVVRAEGAVVAPGVAADREVELGTHDEAPAAPRRGGKRVSVASAASHAADVAVAEPEAVVDADQVTCPKCGGRTWDNRLTKRNPKAPDFKCRDRSCDGVIWPPRTPRGDETPEPVAPASMPGAAALDASPLGSSGDDDLPF
ncbi:MAG TPA: Rad52/Rad22 family DNA repair protein [Gemmatirosa sp.]|nr:Rad52/Rad22 family DNA repair protein [Gemmatirosa sp.]